MARTVKFVPAPEPELATVPRRVDRATGARLVSLHFFPVTPRSLQDWPLAWSILGGKAVCETAALFACAEAKLAAARPARPVPGRKSAAKAPAEAAA